MAQVYHAPASPFDDMTLDNWHEDHSNVQLLLDYMARTYPVSRDSMEQIAYAAEKPWKHESTFLEAYKDYACDVDDGRPGSRERAEPIWAALKAICPHPSFSDDGEGMSCDICQTDEESDERETCGYCGEPCILDPHFACAMEQAQRG